MSNISVRKENGGFSTAQREWDPIRLARDFLRWDPFREMAPSFAALEAVAFAPAFEVKETKEGYVFKADMPGVQEKDLDITRTGNRLTVTGKREAEHEDRGETYYACERSYGTFTRSFTLPEGIAGEQIHADLRDGVLTLVVPKVPEAQPKKIALKGPEKKS